MTIVVDPAEASTSTTTVTVTLAPTASDPRSHSTIPPVSEHEPTGSASADTKPTRGGNSSVSTTAVAGDGPGLETSIR